jgi:hypothetical protein
MDGHAEHAHTHGHALVESAAAFHGGAAAQQHAPHRQAAHSMAFSQSVDCILLFTWWHPTTLATYLLSLIGVFCLCILSEWLSAYSRRASASTAVGCHGSVERMPLFSSGSLKAQSASSGLLSGLRPILLNACAVGLSYMPMLLAMSFNVGVFVTVAIGIAVGRVCFSPAYTSDATRGPVELCH